MTHTSGDSWCNMVVNCVNFVVLDVRRPAETQRASGARKITNFRNYLASLSGQLLTLLVLLQENDQWTWLCSPEWISCIKREQQCSKLEPESNLNFVFEFLSLWTFPTSWFQWSTWKILELNCFQGLIDYKLIRNIDPVGLISRAHSKKGSGREVLECETGSDISYPRREPRKFSAKDSLQNRVLSGFLGILVHHLRQLMQIPLLLKSSKRFWGEILP